MSFVAMERFTLAILPASLVGGLAAFLCYNWKPAKVFMGDTGSLFLGGAVCGTASGISLPQLVINARHAIHVHRIFMNFPPYSLDFFLVGPSMILPKYLP